MGIMNIQHYTYEDFLVYSLSYFGLSSVVERKAREGRNANQLEVQKLVHIMDDCSRMDLSDRARFFKALYKKFFLILHKLTSKKLHVQAPIDQIDHD